MNRLAIALALLIVLALPVVAGEEPAKKQVKEEAGKPIDPVHHALVQKKVGFYAVYLPPDYSEEANADRTWPVCLILHGHGSTETGHGGLSNSFGRKGVIYVAPRAAHAHREIFIEEKKPGWTVWPTFPPSWGDRESPNFPKSEMEAIAVDRLFTDFIADCIADVRKRYRTDGKRVVVVGHSMGAAFAHKLALHRPELVRAYFAYAGFYSDSTKDGIAALTLKKHGIHAVLAHCEGDEVVEVEETRALVKYLTGHEIEHEVVLQPGGGHSFTTRISHAARTFVAKQCRGVTLPPLRGDLVVTEVVPDSQAAKIGLRKDDVITSYGGKAIQNLDDLHDAIGAVEEGTKSVVLEWRRGEEKMKATIEPGRIGVMLADR